MYEVSWDKGPKRGGQPTRIRSHGIAAATIVIHVAIDDVHMAHLPCIQSCHLR